MNANAIHNLLNLALLIVGVLATFDWSVFGLDPTATTKLIGVLVLVQTIIKLAMNIYRDGVTGLVKEQPPVIDQT